MYDHSPKVLRTVYATKVQLDLEYGTANDVAMFTVKSGLFSPAFAIANALHQTLCHWDFKIADHEIKDVVLVKFKYQK